MGYYTYYELSIYDQNLKLMTNSHHEDIIKQLYVLYPEAEYAIEETGNPRQSTKWYDCYDDIKEFSKRFPWLLFRIDEEGENGDEALTYIKNGKSQYCQITKTYEDYDESKLQ
jgi:hypothetical protein